MEYYTYFFKYFPGVDDNSGSKRPPLQPRCPPNSNIPLNSGSSGNFQPLNLPSSGILGKRLQKCDGKVIQIYYMRLCFIYFNASIIILYCKFLLYYFIVFYCKYTN